MAKLYKRRYFCFLILIVSLVYFACGPRQSSIIPPLPTITNTPNPTTTNTPIPTITITSISPITPTQTQQATRTPYPRYIYDTYQNIAISPNGEMIAVATIYGMQVYSLTTKEILYSSDYKHRARHHRGAYTRIAWSSNSQYLAIGTLNDGIHIWSVSPWELATEIVLNYNDPAYPFVHPGFEWSPDGSQIVVGILAVADLDEDEIIPGRVLIWDASSNTWEKIYDGDVITVAWWDDGQIVVMLEGSLVDISSGATRTIVEDESIGKNVNHMTVIWSPDERYYCQYFDFWPGDIYDLYRKEDVSEIDCYPPLAWSMDGKYLATRNSRTTINIWDSSKKTESTIKIEGASVDIFAYAWSPQGDLYVLGVVDENERTLVWNASTNEIVLEIR